MSLFFLHPIYLYGLIAASLPLLIHLLNRRRRKKIRFPAVRFVLLSQRRISRSYRLRHWILLALRTFAVILLALLLANPIFQTGVGLFAGSGSLSLVVVLDNSLSMKWSRGGEGFKQAKQAVRLFISSLKDGDRASVIPTDISERSRIRLKGERELLLRELDGIQIAAGTADFSVALSKAYELLKEPAAQREIWLITDMALTGWDHFSPSTLGQYDPLIPLKIIKVGKKGEPLNATIKEIRMRSEGVGVGLPIHLEASLINFSDKEIKELLVQLNINDKAKEQKVISLPPKGELGVSFQFRLKKRGSHDGYVTIKKDGLAGNPKAYFTLHAQDRLKVLVVDGDPQTSLAQSETFFLTRALNPAGERDSSLFLPTVVIPEGLSSVSLDSYQALIFCNVAAISDALLPRLRAYLHQGGGLLLFLGDRVQMDNYNLKLFQSSPRILPARLRDKNILSEPAGVKIEKVVTAHPALKGVADQLLKQSLKSTRVRGYFRTDNSAGSALLTLDGGDALLIEKKIGRGRVLLFTTAADRDWSDLPLKTGYLPLLQSLVSYLSGGKRGMMDAGITVGSPKIFSFPPSYVGKNLRIAKPDRKQREVIFIPDGKNASASFRENDLAGIYRLSLPARVAGQVSAPETYPVNSPFFESRLETISEQELQAKFNPIRMEIIPIESLDKTGKRRDLSLPLLVLLIVTLASEGWIGQRMYG
ncbi:MAG: BatA and WFA domain-containing protein [Deltaproteobacteria bacterium]|nr:BatA and WFA domain-containing protein [Deltaproteobacteria bacterium]